MNVILYLFRYCIFASMFPFFPFLFPFLSTDSKILNSLLLQHTALFNYAQQPFCTFPTQVIVLFFFAGALLNS